VCDRACGQGRPLIGAEEFIEGVFQKHNNNVGGVVAGGGAEERATPNAFSHFTWEASNHSLLVCDIQVERPPFPLYLYMYIPLYLHGVHYERPFPPP